jgi:hypothetical protein
MGLLLKTVEPTHRSLAGFSPALEDLVARNAITPPKQQGRLESAMEMPLRPPLSSFK